MRRCPTSGPASGRRRTRPTSRAGWSPASAGASTALLQDLHREGVGRAGRAMPADWAAQRIKDLSLGKAIVNALLPKRNQKDITSLIEEFQYPKYGPGMMWEVCRDKVEAQGSKVRMRDRGHPGPPRGRPGRRGRGHRRPTASATALPLRPTSSRRCRSRSCSRRWTRRCPPTCCRRPRASRYRDFLTVALVVPEPTCLARQLDLRPRPRGRASGASRTSGRGRRTW